MKRVLVLSHYGKSLIRFRGDLIKKMVEKGHDVTVTIPEHELKEKVERLGVNCLIVPMNRTGMNPLEDYRYYLEVKKIISEISPDLVFAYAMKTVIYGGMAARSMNKKIDMVSMIAGAGYVFTGNTRKVKLIRMVVKTLYRRALPFNKVIFFQNPDDLELYQSLNLLGKAKTVRVNGSGVNLDEFAEVEPPIEPVTFLLVARMIWDKGIGEYTEACRLTRDRGYTFRAWLLGPVDSNPSAISKKEVNNWVAEGVLEYIEETADVRPYLENCSVYVLPSYREGTPRSVLEAMAVGRPVITTDAPGCRETVIEGENGYLVPVKNAEILAETMIKFIENPETIAVMGKISRNMAEERFDVHKVNEVMMREMGL